MFQEMRLAATLQAMRHGPGALPARDVVLDGHARGRAGARTRRRDRRRSRPARRADLIVVGDRRRCIRCRARDPVLARSSTRAGPSDVRATIVDGEVVARDGAARLGGSAGRRGRRRRQRAARARARGPGRDWTDSFCYTAVSTLVARLLTPIAHEHRPDGTPTADSGPPGRGVHRAGRAGVVGLAGRAQRARAVVGDRAQHPGAARGTGPRPPAAHLGRARADRFRLSPVRRLAARVAQAVAPAARHRSAAAARAARSATCSRTRRRSSRAPRTRSASRSRRRRRRSGCATSTSCTLDGHRVLVIVVATGGQITHKVIDTDGAAATTRRSTQAANYINARVRGPDAARGAQRPSSSSMRQERMLYDALMSRALRLAQTGLDDLAPEETLHVQGASFLVDELLGESADRDRTLETLRALFRMIEEKHRLVELLTQYIEAGGLTVVIGSEHIVAGSASVQRGRVDVPRRRPHRHGRRHRSDAHALSARDLGRRRRVADAVAAARRPCNLNVGSRD